MSRESKYSNCLKSTTLILIAVFLIQSIGFQPQAFASHSDRIHIAITPENALKFKISQYPQAAFERAAANKSLAGWDSVTSWTLYIVGSAFVVYYAYNYLPAHLKSLGNALEGRNPDHWPNLRRDQDAGDAAVQMAAPVMQEAAAPYHYEAPTFARVARDNNKRDFPAPIIHAPLNPRRVDFGPIPALDREKDATVQRPLPYPRFNDEPFAEEEKVDPTFQYKAARLAPRPQAVFHDDDIDTNQNDGGLFHNFLWAWSGFRGTRNNVQEVVPENYDLIDLTKELWMHNLDPEAPNAADARNAYFAEAGIVGTSLVLFNAFIAYPFNRLIKYPLLKAAVFTARGVNEDGLDEALKTMEINHTLACKKFLGDSAISTENNENLVRTIRLTEDDIDNNEIYFQGNRLSSEQIAELDVNQDGIFHVIDDFKCQTGGYFNKKVSSINDSIDAVEANNSEDHHEEPIPDFEE